VAWGLWPLDRGGRCPPGTCAASEPSTAWKPGNPNAVLQARRCRPTTTLYGSRVRRAWQWLADAARRGKMAFMLSVDRNVVPCSPCNR